MEWLNDYFVSIVVGICLCVGYVVKTTTPINNKYIPAIVAIYHRIKILTSLN